MSEISIYKRASDVTSDEQINIYTFFANVRNGKWKDQIEKVRSMPSGPERDEAKKKLPGATMSGIFQPRNDKALKAFSGFICVDFDKLVDLEDTRKQLGNDRYTYGIFTSVSGNGLAVLVKVDGNKFKEAFEGLQAYYMNKYGLLIDPSCSNISRLRFVSYDPNAEIKNDQSPIFAEYVKKSPGRPKKENKHLFIHTERELEYVLSQIESRFIDITGGYDEWYKIGWSLISKYGEGAREYFHRVSQWNNSYDANECDKKFKYLLQTRPEQINIGTFYHYAKLAGLEVISPKSDHIAKCATMQKRVGVSAEGVISTLEKMEGISAEESREVVEMVFQSEQEIEINEDTIAQIESYVKQFYDLRFNLITQSTEMAGKPMTDRDANSIYVEMKKAVGKEVTKSDCEAVINSNRIPSYNPLLEFFQKYSYRTPVGLINKLASSITVPQDQKFKDHVYPFLFKWLVGMISSIHGEHSPLLLVLCGGQNTGKTQFFRRLLPPELSSYYAESKLDKEQEAEMILCSKLIVMDDEFGGKSKKEATKLKEMTSKQEITVRLPYGKRIVNMKRLAMLCGTSNDVEVINDPTGNRRIIPIVVEKIDHAVYNSIDKVDLLLEAYHAYKNGATAELDGDLKSLLDDTSQGNISYTPERELLLKYFSAPAPGTVSTFMTNTEIKVYIEQRSQQRLSSKMLGMELKALGFPRVAKKINTVTVWGYSLTEIFT